MTADMTGWEIDATAVDAILNDDQQALLAFIDGYGPLAAYEDERKTLAVIRRYHPTLNCDPDDETYKTGDDFSVRLALYASTSTMYAVLPKSLTYERLEIAPNLQAGAFAVDFIITTMECGPITTNAFELTSVLAPNYVPLPENAMREAFSKLENARFIPKPRIEITSTSITLQSVGRLDRSDFEDWWRAVVDVPMLENPLPVTVTDFNPQDPAQHAHAALFDAAIAAFLRFDARERAASGLKILANCHAYIEAIGEEDWNRAMAQCRDPIAIWQFVQPKDLYVQYHEETASAYVTLACECAWEEEHGLQLVYRDGMTLTRVSEQDGHLTG